MDFGQYAGLVVMCALFALGYGLGRHHGRHRSRCAISGCEEPPELWGRFCQRHTEAGWHLADKAGHRSY